MKIAVIGGGNGGYAAAADLTFNGHKIFFFFEKIVELIIYLFLTLKFCL